MSKFTMSPCGKLWYSEEYDDDKTLRAGSRDAVVDKALSLVRHDDMLMFREDSSCGYVVGAAAAPLRIRSTLLIDSRHASMYV